jgi:hypothetical protein
MISADVAPPKLRRWDARGCPAFSGSAASSPVGAVFSWLRHRARRWWTSREPRPKPSRDQAKTSEIARNSRSVRFGALHSSPSQPTQIAVLQVF